MNDDSITTVLNNDLQKLLTTIYQNENYILIKLKHPSLLR